MPTIGRSSASLEVRLSIATLASMLGSTLKHGAVIVNNRHRRGWGMGYLKIRTPERNLKVISPLPDLLTTLRRGGTYLQLAERCGHGAGGLLSSGRALKLRGDRAGD